MTLSIGVAVVRGTLERSPDGALQLANEALDAAKREERNRVIIFEREWDTLSAGSFCLR